MPTAAQPPGEPLKEDIMPLTLPVNANLEHLKSQAKSLLKLALAGDQASLERLQRVNSLEFTLADAQFVIAREYGFPNWARLKHHVAALQAPTLRTTARRAYIHQLAHQLLEAARTRDLEGLSAKVILPLRDLLDLRSRVVELGLHAVLVDGLLSGLESSHSRVRYLCADALDHLADERCAAPLERLLTDPVPRVRRAALHALSCDACKLAPLPKATNLFGTLMELSKSDPNARVRNAALEALVNSCDPRAAPVLLELLVSEVIPGRRRFLAAKLEALGKM